MIPDIHGGSELTIIFYIYMEPELRLYIHTEIDFAIQIHIHMTYT